MDFFEGVVKLLPVIEEYYRLICQQTLREEDSDRIQEILDNAQDNPMLDFLIDEVDHILGHEFKLIDEKSIREQQDKLKPLVDSVWLENQVHAHALKEAQMRLKEEGLYDGQIDGVLGSVTKKALQAFRLMIYDQLRKDGISVPWLDELLKKDQNVAEILYQSGKQIDSQSINLLNLETEFS